MTLENLRQKFKIFNYRPLVLVFLALCAGILVNHFITRETVITIVGIVLVSTALIFYSILHKKFKYFIIFGLCFLLGFGSFQIFMNTHMHSANDHTNYYAQGVVTSITNRGSYLELLVEDVEIDGKDLEYNIMLDYYNIYQDGYHKIDNGTKIKFKISKQWESSYYYEGIPHTSNLANNVGMGASTYELEVVGTKNTARYTILDKVRNNLRNGINNLNGEMIYSAMFGDKTELNHDLYDAYKSSGVAHLLAVSGLHVGLVVAILNWLMKKCKVKGWWRVGIIAPLLFGYAYLCGFSYSIIRASIMALVLMIAPLLFSEYDTLSSICFAGALILLIEPIALFSLPAQLSFGCVFGIVMLYPIFKRWLNKIRINNAVTDSFCISLATIVSTAIIMAYYFNKLQPIGLISNIVIIPIFGVLFTISFVVAMLSLILPFVSFALILVNPLFEWLNWAIIFIANHAKALALPSVNYLTIILFFVLLAFASKFNLKKGLNKLTLVGICSCVLALQMALM